MGGLILFGPGGTAVELLDDKALAMPSLNMRLAHEVMSQTTIYRLLQGYRDRPPAALDAIAETLIKISRLVIDHPEIDELDINPLLADDFGVIALDVRVKLTPTDKTGQGLGELMMGRLITYARKRSVGEIHGEVLRKNTPMLGLCDKLGFAQSTVPDDPSIIHVSLDLRA